MLGWLKKVHNLDIDLVRDTVQTAQENIKSPTHRVVVSALYSFQQLIGYEVTRQMDVPLCIISGGSSRWGEFINSDFAHPFPSTFGYSDIFEWTGTQYKSGGVTLKTASWRSHHADLARNRAQSPCTQLLFAHGEMTLGRSNTQISVGSPNHQQAVEWASSM